ncbi:response regulator transcription factor [Actinoplanes xinjiangensis]|uniref:response regulator transcription factor n=1 Tax=Actinoplanes xinjiangensis TaxID=512350 RepID=UPI001EF187F6|nr:response regulator transcription factor [Actinoplanes xinjiangensis]
MSNTERVLVVDDEPNISELLGTALRFVGYDVRTAGDAGQALAVAESFRPDLVVLDVMLPDLDGFQVCHRLRGLLPQIRVVFLTARNQAADAVTGLTDAGGDEYIRKPFDLDELIARVALVLRRGAVARPRRLHVADLVLDQDTYDVNRDDRPLSLSPTEFRLLNYLMLNTGRVVSKEQIRDQVWQYDFAGEVGVVENYISYLRRKLGDPPLIRTVRGVGYQLRSPRPGAV